MNKLITLSTLANWACAVGCGLGFNAATVVRRYDIDTDKTTLGITWGNKDRLQTPISQDWARAYDETTDCVREPRTFAFQEDELLHSSYEQAEKKFTDKLLELV